MLIAVAVHPIDVNAHPSVPSGYRWAVHVGDDFTNLDPRWCLNAGWEPTVQTAAIAGEAAAVCAARVARRLGQPAEVRTFHLLTDPTGGRDPISLGG